MHGKRPTITSMHGVVAAAHPLAAQAGARLLATGGNAFDAAAATAAALNVVEPFMSGLAGMGLATCWVAAEKRVRSLDFVSRIPEHFPVDKLSKREQLARGALSVGAPGNYAGWCELVRAHGTKPMSEILSPAIALARDGFAFAEFGVFETVQTEPEIKQEKALYKLWSDTYTNGKGTVRLGDVLRQPDLAKTFEILAAEGPDAVYRGTLAKAIVAHLQSLDGCLTMADMAAVKPVWKEPIRARYRELDVHVPPAPCEGFQFLLTLRILDGFDLASKERNGLDHLDTVYRAIRLAAGERINNNNPSSETLARLFSDQHVEALRKRVADGKPITGPTEQWMKPEPGMREGHTTSLSVGDRFGNLVCITNSLGSPYGSAVVVPGTGICLNNFLYWAEVTPESPNRAKPKGPLNMCVSPSISLRDGEAVLALGTPGSYGILQTQSQAMVQYAGYGQGLQDAIEAPRARLWDGRVVEQENRVAPEVIDGLRKRGHEVTVGEQWTMRCGGMQAVSRDPATGVLTGAADPRRDGYVATA